MSASTPSGTPGAGGSTPGPWESKSFDEAQTVILGGNEFIAVVSVGKHRPHGDANAALIARAPDLDRQVADLRAALDYALDTLEKFYVDDCECDDCNQCDKVPQDCTGTECARTCQCNECRYCHAERALESGGDILKATRTALRASEGGPETGGAS